MWIFGRPLGFYFFGFINLPGAYILIYHYFPIMFLFHMSEQSRITQVGLPTRTTKLSFLLRSSLNFFI